MPGSLQIFPVSPLIIQVRTLCSSLPYSLDVFSHSLLSFLRFSQTLMPGFEWVVTLTWLICLERKQTYTPGNYMSLSLLKSLIPPFSQYPPSAQGATSAAQTDLPVLRRSPCAHHPTPSPLGTASSQILVENQVLTTLTPKVAHIPVSASGNAKNKTTVYLKTLIST